MSVRPPKAFGRAGRTPSPLAALEHELIEETASTYDRLLSALRTALAGLEHVEPGESAAREALEDKARTALWHVMIQRELMGLRSHEAFLRDLRVPRRISAMVGAIAPRGGRPAPGEPPG